MHQACSAQPSDLSAVPTDPIDVSENQQNAGMTSEEAARRLSECRCDCGCDETFEPPVIWEG